MYFAKERPNKLATGLPYDDDSICIPESTGGGVSFDESDMDPLAEKNLLIHVTDFLADNIPNFKQELPQAVRDKMIRHSIKVARSYGFETERNIAVFVGHMMIIGPEFHNQPHIHSILTDNNIPIGERLRRLITDLTEKDAEQASKMVNSEDYWACVLRQLDANITTQTKE